MSEAEMEKGADMQTLSAKIFENCGLWKIIYYYCQRTHINCKIFFHKYQIFGIFIAYERLFPEKFQVFGDILRYLFTEISIVYNMGLQKD